MEVQQYNDQKILRIYKNNRQIFLDSVSQVAASFAFV